MFLVALTLVAAALARSPEVYCVYTDFGPLNEQTIVVSGRINLYNGTTTKQNTLFRYLGEDDVERKCSPIAHSVTRILGNVRRHQRLRSKRRHVFLHDRLCRRMYALSKRY